jgi:thiamine-phosphate pyrophosphorylase
MILNRLKPGLYAITDPDLISASDLHAQVAAALRGGAVMIQYRNKRASRDEACRQASSLADLCKRFRAPLIVNDDAELAHAVGADGVHIGTTDGRYADARALVGPRALVGVSCYNSLDRAVAAQAAGADYVAFGRFFPSRTKPDALQASPTLLRDARQVLNIPIVAIGGITPENASILMEAGAHMLAVIHGVFGGADPENAARRYSAFFTPD